MLIDAYSIDRLPTLSIPIESHRSNTPAYIPRMAKRKVWQDWGARFRTECRLKGTSTRALSEKLGLAESSVRSWLNGTREINLSDFFLLCDTAGIDPATVLFAGRNDPRFHAIQRTWSRTDERGKEVLLMAEEVARRYESGTETAGNNSVPPRRGGS